MISDMQQLRVDSVLAVLVVLSSLVRCYLEQAAARRQRPVHNRAAKLTAQLSKLAFISWALGTGSCDIT